MKSLSEKFKKENEFFINKKTKKIQYNKKCQNCKNKCKQSYQAVLINCLKFERKDNKNV